MCMAGGSSHKSESENESESESFSFFLTVPRAQGALISTQAVSHLSGGQTVAAATLDNHSSITELLRPVAVLTAA